MNRFFWKFFFAFWAVLILTASAAGFFVISDPEGVVSFTNGISAGIYRLLHAVPPGSRPSVPFPWANVIAFLFSSILVCVALAWSLTNPINKFRRAFDALADGDLTTRVMPMLGRRKDEIGQLGVDFDRMVEKLQALIESQHRLFHDVSHELRSPLARLHASIGLFRQRAPEEQTTIGRLEKEIGRIDCLVGEILTLARLDSGLSGVMDDEIELLSLLQEIVDDAELEATVQNKHVRLIEPLPEQAYLRGNAELVGRALENVVRNALRYTAEGTTVAVTLSASHFPQTGVAAWQVMVEDEGPGIADADLARICEPFFRGSSSVPHTGYGLGLAIASRSAKAHGGSIDIANREQGGLNGGLRVTFLLPTVILQDIYA
jgi:two-component system OmpR family sensor kinase